jgi:hypothetical protein
VKTLWAGKDVASDLGIMEINGGAIIKCSYESCVKVLNKFNIQSQNPSIVTLHYVRT